MIRMGFTDKAREIEAKLTEMRTTRQKVPRAAPAPIHRLPPSPLLLYATYSAHTRVLKR